MGRQMNRDTQIEGQIGRWTEEQPDEQRQKDRRERDEQIDGLMDKWTETDR